jgi:hypothetical protein
MCSSLDNPARFAQYLAVQGCPWRRPDLFSNPFPRDTQNDEAGHQKARDPVGELADGGRDRRLSSGASLKVMAAQD